MATALIAVASPRRTTDHFNDAIYSIDLQRRPLRADRRAARPMGAMALSPDGNTIAYVCGRVDGPEAHDLYLQPVDGGTARNLTGRRSTGQ